MDMRVFLCFFTATRAFDQICSLIWSMIWSSLAGAGEILITEATRASADLPKDGFESRHLQVKGRTAPVESWAVQVDAPVPTAAGG